MVQIRRQSMYELQIFKERWERAVEENKNWVVDQVKAIRRRRKRRRKQIPKSQVKLR